MLKKINNMYNMLLALKRNLLSYSVISLIILILISKEIFIFDEEIIVAFNFILIIYLFYKVAQGAINNAINNRQQSIFNIINNAIITNEYFLKSNIYSLINQQSILQNINVLKAIILSNYDHLLKYEKNIAETNIDSFILQRLEDFKSEEQNVLKKDFELFVKKSVNYIQNNYDKN
uniref:ATP synthase F0 subunit b n=1 Tax=Cyanoptyche gloeocystis TaxID=77922 RepID=A0A096Y6W4_9EUKA|nr:ATP synthase F0 subunit b [Cyanoptyche gloeocystis]AIM52057.1 ATP synthase F0 subunit b [Cyanoptyche gloeocystis]